MSSEIPTGRLEFFPDVPLNKQYIATLKLAEFLSWKGSSLQKIMAIYQQSLEIAQQMQDPRNIAISYCCMAKLCKVNRDFEGSIQYFESVLKMFPLIPEKGPLEHNWQIETLTDLREMQQLKTSN